MTITLKTIAEINALGATLEDTSIERSILWYMLKDSNTLNFKGKSATFLKKFFATKELFDLVPMANFKKVAVNGELEKSKVFQFRATGNDDQTALCQAKDKANIVELYSLNLETFELFNESLDLTLALFASRKKSSQDAEKQAKAEKLAAFQAVSPTNTKEKFDSLEKQKKAIESAIKAFENAELDTTDLTTLLDGIESQLSGGEAAPLQRA